MEALTLNAEASRDCCWTFDLKHSWCPCHGSLESTIRQAGLSGHWPTPGCTHCFGGAGTWSQIKGDFYICPSKPTQMFAFTTLLGWPPSDLGDWNGNCVWLGETWCLCGEWASLWKQILFAPALHWSRSQASAATRLPYRTHREVGFVRRKFLPEAFLLWDRVWGLSPKDRWLWSNYSIFCKGQRTLESQELGSAKDLSAVSEVSRGLKGIDWCWVPREMHFQVPFCQRLYVLLLINPLGRKKVSVLILSKE